MRVTGEAVGPKASSPGAYCATGVEGSASGVI